MQDVSKVRPDCDYVEVALYPRDGAVVIAGDFNPVGDSRKGWWRQPYWLASRDSKIKIVEESKRNWLTPDRWLNPDRCLMQTIEIPEGYAYWVVRREKLPDGHAFEVLFQPKIQKCDTCHMSMEAWHLQETLLDPVHDLNRVNYQLFCESCRATWEQKQSS